MDEAELQNFNIFFYLICILICIFNFYDQEGQCSGSGRAFAIPVVSLPDEVCPGGDWGGLTMGSVLFTLCPGSSTGVPCVVSLSRSRCDTRAPRGMFHGEQKRLICHFSGFFGKVSGQVPSAAGAAVSCG